MRQGPGGRASRLAPPLVAMAALLTLYGLGAVRLAHAVKPDPAAPMIRIVQADVPQEAKYETAGIRAIFDRYVALTALPPKPGARPIDIVVWSEGAVPVSANEMLAPDSWTAQAIAAAMHPGESLLLGAYRIAGDPDRPVYYNSLIATRAGANGLAITGVYDKYRLVPFGEYLPMPSILQAIGFKDLTHIGDSFAFGPRPRAIAPAGMPAVQPLICYEGLFPGFTREGVARGGPRPSWIVNVSNDAWFGVTSGPIQHLNLASYRAIEEGLPIVRATPTGVSAIIDSYGRVESANRLGLEAKGVVDAPLPSRSANTTYSRLGDLPLALLFVLSVLSIGAPALLRAYNLPSTSSALWTKHESGTGAPREEH